MAYCTAVAGGGGKPAGSCLPCNQQAWRSGLGRSTALHAWNLRRFPCLLALLRPAGSSFHPWTGNRRHRCAGPAAVASHRARALGIEPLAPSLPRGHQRDSHTSMLSAGRLVLHPPLARSPTSTPTPTPTAPTPPVPRTRELPGTISMPSLPRRSPRPLPSRSFTAGFRRAGRRVLRAKPAAELSWLPTPTPPPLFLCLLTLGLFHISSQRRLFSRYASPRPPLRRLLRHSRDLSHEDPHVHLHRQPPPPADPTLGSGSLGLARSPRLGRLSLFLPSGALFVSYNLPQAVGNLQPEDRLRARIGR